MKRRCRKCKKRKNVEAVVAAVLREAKEHAYIPFVDGFPRYKDGYHITLMEPPFGAQPVECFQRIDELADASWICKE